MKAFSTVTLASLPLAPYWAAKRDCPDCSGSGYKGYLSAVNGPHWVTVDCDCRRQTELRCRECESPDLLNNTYRGYPQCDACNQNMRDLNESERRNGH